MKSLFAGAAMLLAVAGCGKVEKNVDKATPEGTAAAKIASNVDRARDAARVANAMKEHPAAADSVLAAAGFSRDSFEKTMFEIAADSAMSAEYAAAKKP